MPTNVNEILVVPILTESDNYTFVAEDIDNEAETIVVPTISESDTYTLVAEDVETPNEDLILPTLTFSSVPKIPVVDFSYRISGTTASFYNATTNVPTGYNTVDYLWDFGDSSGAATADARHKYAAVTSYTVTLTITYTFDYFTIIGVSTQTITTLQAGGSIVIKMKVNPIEEIYPNKSVYIQASEIGRLFSGRMEITGLDMGFVEDLNGFEDAQPYYLEAPDSATALSAITDAEFIFIKNIGREYVSTSELGDKNENLVCVYVNGTKITSIKSGEGCWYMGDASAYTIKTVDSAGAVISGTGNAIMWLIAQAL